MLKFARKLTLQQYYDFFERIGRIYSIIKPFQEDMICLFFEDESGKRHKCTVTDNKLFAQNYYKGSEDWKLYMLKLFGLEYLEEFGEAPINNNFIDKLSLNDVKELLQLRGLRVEKLMEKPAFRKGTRSFIVKYSSSMYPFQEIVIGPHIAYCSGLLGISEILFMKYFTQKFGKEFIDYYSKVKRIITVQKKK